MKQRCTVEQLRERCAYWQQVLRLQDWRVTVHIKRARDMEGSQSNGEVDIILAKRWAEITLRDPVDVRPDYAHFNDLEETLVHELLHLHVEPFDLPDSGPKQVAEEQMINALAGALVELDRRR